MEQNKIKELKDNILKGLRFLELNINEFYPIENENWDQDLIDITYYLEVIKSKLLGADILFNLEIDIQELITPKQDRLVTPKFLRNLGSDGSLAKLKVGNDLYYADPFLLGLTWIHSKKFTSYIYDTYYLDPTELCNILKLRSDNYQNLCLNCGSKVYVDRISHGIPLFCSVECSSNYNSEFLSNKLKKQWEDPEFRNLVTELSRERLTEQWEDPDFRSIVSNAMIITSNDTIVRAKIHRSRFISETPSTSKCYFYVTRSVYEDKS